MRTVVVIVALIAACHSGRDDATTTIEAYQRLVTKACRCKDVACANTTSWEWLTTGKAAPLQYSEATASWLLELGLHFDQCIRRAQSEQVEMVEY